LDRAGFQKIVVTEIRRLFQVARQRDECSFLFAVLGINSGEEDPGWQPGDETQALVQDLLGLINGPLHKHAKARIALLLYCHIIEANFLYHCLYNMLLTVDRQPPLMFSFLDKYQRGVPPSVSVKLSMIKSKAIEHGFDRIKDIFDEIVRSDIRNAFFHSDYVLFDDELRLKHRGSQYARIHLTDMYDTITKTVDFFYCVKNLMMESRRSFPKGHVITGRKAPDGRNLSSVLVLLDERGVAVGIRADDPLPVW
jgi:hypothetical protein